MPVAAAPARAAGGWLVSPWFDLFFIANLAWPLLVLAQLAGDGFAGREGVQFWQIYYVTTPHRWITLLIVFLDRERFQQRRGIFIGLAVVFTLVCLGVRLTTGALTCLLAIDYVWNAWHFASQHHGIYRVYGRMGEPSFTRGLTLEKWGLRGFLLYVTFRVAGATWGEPSWEEALRTCDWFVALIPIGLIARDLLRARVRSIARTTYLVSVSFLYLAMLWAVHENRLGLMLAIVLAGALFHAIEYLAIVSWSVRQRHAARGGEMGILAHFVPRWALVLVVFMLVLGAGSWFLDQRLVEGWLFINVVVAFLHYAYDGLIWKRRSA